MKVVLTGSTGFIGSEILRQCLQHPTITSVIALVRREMPNQSNPKLKQVIMKDDDFLAYPDNIKAELKGVDALIWALGAISFPNEEVMRKVSVDYNIAAGKAFAATAAADGKKVRLVWVSGALVEQDQSSKLWFMDHFRHVRGDGEVKLLDVVHENPNALGVVFAKPAFVLGKGNMAASLINPLGMSITVAELAATLIDYALNGGWPSIQVDNATLQQKGAALLKAAS